jgi:penicillin-binding protein 2
MNVRGLYKAVLTALLVATLTVSGTRVASAATASTAKRHHKRVVRKTGATKVTSHAIPAATGAVPLARTTFIRHRRSKHVFFNPWTEPTYADSTLGDNVDGEDLVVRRAAVDALGPYNGTVVVADPQTGRILSIVNQKLAFKGAYQPCSTVKMVVSLASLSEGLVNAQSSMHISRRFSMDMTQALARSNNMFFAKLGEELGFDRVERYGKLFGLGEKAGLDIPEEEPGTLTSDPPGTGVGMMTSFGDGIRLTPLELTSIVSTIANGGTMYYLQYPKSEAEVEKFVPRIKRELEISSFIPEIKPGMMGAVEYGTARRAVYDPNEPIYGKTGTCTDTAQPGVHLGWFGSFNEVQKNRIVVVVLLTGGRGISGPIASGIAGAVYHNLTSQHYFGEPQPAPAIATSLISFR